MNMEFVRKLPVPLEIKEAYPQSFAMAQVKAKMDAEMRKIFTGESQKLLLVIGPCSADREDAVLEYVDRLRALQEKVAERLLLYREGAVVSQSDVLHILGDRGKAQPSPEIMPLAKLEETAIMQALERCGTTLEGKKRAAAQLGISLSGLYKKLRQYERRDAAAGGPGEGGAHG